MYLSNWMKKYEIFKTVVRIRRLGIGRQLTLETQGFNGLSHVSHFMVGTHTHTHYSYLRFKVLSFLRYYRKLQHDLFLPHQFK